MGHHIHLFVGHPEVLRRYAETSALAQLYRLTPGAELAVLPLDEALQDDMHKHSGTGEWLDTLRLTTADMSLAADCSRRGSIAYLETDYFGGVGIQAAVLWGGGALAIRPTSMRLEQSVGRPRATWPINAVLRGLGIVAAAGLDEFDTFGLGQYRSHDAVRARGLRVRIGA
jgi:hypothetical protein